MKIEMKDGYWVESDGPFLKWGKGSKKYCVRADRMKSIPSGHPSEKVILASGSKLEDYLSNGSYILRNNPETAPVIADALAECVEFDRKRADEERARIGKIQSEKQEAQSKCSFSDPAECRVEWFDGEIVRAFVGNVQVPIDRVESFDSSFRRCDFNFVSQATVSECESITTQADAQRLAERSAKQADRAARFEESRTTGHPVKLMEWTENRRVKEGLEWGDYQFLCTEFAMPDGTTKISAVNTY